MSRIKIPQSAKDTHIAIKVLERTKESILIFSLLKTPPTNGSSSKRCLKIVTNQPPHINKDFISMLKSIQHQSSHPLVRIIDHDVSSDHVR